VQIYFLFSVASAITAYPPIPSHPIPSNHTNGKRLQPRQAMELGQLWHLSGCRFRRTAGLWLPVIHPQCHTGPTRFPALHGPAGSGDGGADGESQPVGWGSEWGVSGMIPQREYADLGGKGLT